MSKGLEIVPIKDKTKLEVRQSPTPHLPRTPLRMLASAASFSGKSTNIANMILNKRMYRDVWDSIWIFSQSVDHDGTWGEVKKYVRESLNKDPSKHFSVSGMGRRFARSSQIRQRSSSSTKMKAIRNPTRFC